MLYDTCTGSNSRAAHLPPTFATKASSSHRTATVQTIGDIAGDGQMRKKRVILRHETDAAFFRRHDEIVSAFRFLLSAFLKPRFIAEENFPHIRRFQPGETAENSGLRSEEHTSELQSLRQLVC